MIDKISGKIAYAVVSFGGFLGMGEEYFPMPWASLKYDTGLEGYRVNVTEDQLKGAPRFNRNADWDWSDRSRDRTVHDITGRHFGTAPLRPEAGLRTYGAGALVYPSYAGPLHSMRGSGGSTAVSRSGRPVSDR